MSPLAHALFAAENDAATMLGVVSFLSSTVAAVFAYLASRDKIRHDKDMALKDARLKVLEAGKEASEADRREITERLIKVETEYEECREDRHKLRNLIHDHKVQLAVLETRLKPVDPPAPPPAPPPAGKSV